MLSTAIFLERKTSAEYILLEKIRVNFILIKIRSRVIGGSLESPYSLQPSSPSQGLVRSQGERTLSRPFLPFTATYHSNGIVPDKP